MTSDASRESLGFQAEVKQLLHLMIHSLYSHKEIFLRELISNASDACDRLRFQALSDSSLMEDEPDLEIRVVVDPEARMVSVIDNGMGMSRQEAIEQLGTIAKSGTSEFLGKLTGDQRKDSQLIGQFGVGFYSAFMVADRVEVLSRRAGQASTEGVRWASDGEGEFTVETVEQAARGTEVRLHLKAEENEFTDASYVRQLVRRYSDHIAFPVLMRKPDGAEDEDERVNMAKALWTRPRTEITEDEYKEFYRHISHDVDEPSAWSHNKVEGKREYTSLLYVPSTAPFDLWNRESSRGLKLYVQRVFIMDDVSQFLPLYLRFVRGVLDSNDLSLNVSREMLQQDANVEAIRSALTRRVLDMLAKLAADEDEKYLQFWREFGQVLKEGAIEDVGNRSKILELLRFSTTHDDEARQSESLAGYVERTKRGQEEIYYIAADSFTTARNSPHLEVFRDKGVEVLLLSDRVDDWLMSQVAEYDGKPFRDIARGQLELPAVETAADRKKREEAEKEYEGLTARMGELLGDRVQGVRVTDRLTDSPACLVVGEYDLGSQMRRIMQAIGQTVPESKPFLELNPSHPLILRLASEQDDARFEDLAFVLFDQAALAEGGQLADPAAYVRRLNSLLLDLSERS